MSSQSPLAQSLAVDTAVRLPSFPRCKQHLPTGCANELRHLYQVTRASVTAPFYRCSEGFQFVRDGATFIQWGDSLSTRYWARFLPRMEAVSVGRCDMVCLYESVTVLSNRTCSGAAIILQTDMENLFKFPFFAAQSLESSPIV